VRKQGRSLYYTLRRDVLQQLVDDIWMLAPEPRPVRAGRIDHQAGAGRRRRSGAARAQAAAAADTVDREAVAPHLVPPRPRRFPARPARG